MYNSNKHIRRKHLIHWLTISFHSLSQNTDENIRNDTRRICKWFELCKSDELFFSPLWLWHITSRINSASRSLVTACYNFMKWQLWKGFLVFHIIHLNNSELPLLLCLSLRQIKRAKEHNITQNSIKQLHNRITVTRCE